MARRTARRTEWRRTKTGAWTRSLGERGCRVRLFQKRENGTYYREVHTPGRGRDQVPLGTKDREEAEQLGRQLIAALLTGQKAPQRPAGPVRLGELWERYRVECSSYLDNEEHSRNDAAGRAQVLLGFFGRGRDVRTLSAADVARYSTARRAGGIRLESGGVTPAVRQRSVHADLVLLRTVLRWACTVLIDPDTGARLLAHNPLDGLRFDRERNPQRPVATWEQFEATREALRRSAADAASERDRRRFIRLELALVLAEATGRRRGSIVALRWEDIDFAAGRIRWRAEFDKKGVEWVVPAPPALLAELVDFRRRVCAFSGPLFPSARQPAEPMRPEILSQWLVAAERTAGVPKLEGGLWHPYRRKFASERMHHPLKAVAEAGGWRDPGTLLACYQHADDATLLEVLSEPRKRHERAVAAAG